MIAFDNVTMRYGRAGRESTTALANVTLKVPAGGVTAVVGPNGAGKSTLLGLVLGFLRQTAGAVSIAGASPRKWLRHHGAGYLPERFAPPREWRVDRTLRALGRLDGLTRAEAQAVATNAVEHFGLSRHASKNVGALSRGLLQRLGLAQATLVARTLVVLDEPTEGLDPPGRQLFRESVSALRDGGCTVLIASHDLAELERVADRAFLLDSGRLRETIELRVPADRRAWVIALASPVQRVIEIFPDAVVLDATLAANQPAMASMPAARADFTTAGVRYAVTVDDARDLTARLARLIEAGAVINGVTLAGPSLEDRLRQALHGHASPTRHTSPFAQPAERDGGPA